MILTLKSPLTTARIQECHITIGQILCGLIEEKYKNTVNKFKSKFYVKKKIKNICCWSQGDGREFNCKKFEKKKILNCLQLTKAKLI